MIYFEDLPLDKEIIKALSELKNVENYQYRDDDDKILSDFLTIEFSCCT